MSLAIMPDRKLPCRDNNNRNFKESIWPRFHKKQPAFSY